MKYENVNSLLKFEGVIYKITNKVNNKVYIGQTQQHPNKRKTQHFCNTYGDVRNQNSYFHTAIKKYGKENFIFEIIFTWKAKTRENLILILNTLERHYISKFKSNESKFGYNLTSGGQSGFYFKECVTEKRRLKTSGKNSWMYGKHLSIETKSKISDSLKEYFKTHSGPRLGKHMSLEESNKLSEKFRKKSDELLKKKIEISNKPENIIRSEKNQKYIYIMYSLDDVEIKRFRSLYEASRYINRDEKSIRKCLSGERLTCGGYKWKRIDKC